MRWDLVLADCLDPDRGLATLADASVDALVTDPPAGIGFMGREWDSDRGGRVSWISWLEGIARQALRAMKPGAHGVVWALPKTSHWTATALEQAGFEVRDVITHHFGNGFPKSLDVSRAIDEAAGAAREVVGTKLGRPGYHLSGHGGGEALGHGISSSTAETRARAAEITAPATPEALAWSGWGTALKPASEHWILVRKPFPGTVAANVLQHGTGGINVDGCRVDFASAEDRQESTEKNAHADFGSGPMRNNVFGTFNRDRDNYDPTGRFPANLILSHTDWCEEIGSTVVKGDDRTGTGADVGHFFDTGTEGRAAAPAGQLHGDQVVPVWRCLPGCPVAQLDAQSGERPGAVSNGSRGDGMLGTDTFAIHDRPQKPGRADTGGASRFFYVAKPSTAEREADLGHLEKKAARQRLSKPVNGDDARQAKGKRANHHPTVKGIALMSWLVRLVTPPGGVVLDPFAGSGSTGVAALRGGFGFLGWERDPDYHRVAEARIGAAVDGPLFSRVR